MGHTRNNRTNRSPEKRGGGIDGKRKVGVGDRRNHPADYGFLDRERRGGTFLGRCDRKGAGEQIDKAPANLLLGG